MKKISKYLLLFVLSLSITSCLVDDSDFTADFDETSNVVGFTKSSSSIAGVANGDEYMFELPLEVKGPTAAAYTSDVTINISVDPSSTAVEGTNFTLGATSLVLTAANDYKVNLPITLLTQGIAAPLAESPVLKLMVSSADGVDNILPNGKSLDLTLNYLCFSNLAGNYDVTLRYINASAGIDSNYAFTDTLTETGDGEYRSGRVGHWTAAQLGGTPGMTFNDVCNVVSIPYQNLVDRYSNIVEGVAGDSSVDPATGAISFHYTIVVPPATDGREYFVTYTPQ
ncbi:hypothetical protein [Polaribacter ponticola]|uniref:DUF1735 domain-containing protein n=1 Tax=Polaribacter ponticola TaxID=2978475 RepID=A0ABT5S9I6_9FLAO|nr:hypothetical protein [Polaribacter sp. MSW5]MDD7914748.1 hypothetical protein [Polaribacter sp. MSW5]